ncbi:glycolate oxidase subunit GlcE [Roseibium sediminis]|uniref:glycolate oxidase subunit GlcE n=1 Tax=Roseibium sediminis TaxID=1775174 RepID=UPI00123D7EFE|nr:glycolate oxidase subunit GlcE [Roseibium sediminis]
MDANLKPRDAKDVCEAVGWAAAEEQPLEIVGQGSKRSLGRPVQSAHVLDLSGLSGVETYEPAELVLTVRAGTPIREIEQLVAGNGQELSFEPMDMGPLLGREPGEGTIGGVLGANLSGPRRIKAGAARDHVLGLEAVSGRGELFKSGGKVVKNVTGYDLPRALCGSWGTLSVATEITLKVNPKPETSTSLILENLSDEEAIAAMCKAMGSSAEVSGAAHLPASVSEGTARTVLRLEGFSASVAYRVKALQQLLKPYGAAQSVADAASEVLWKSIRDVLPLAGTQDPVWKVSLAPASGAVFGKIVREQFGATLFYDWSGGLVWLSCPDGAPHVDEIRKAVVSAGGGHATLVRADAPVRSSVDVFEPQPAALVALSSRLKHQFDPKGILNPGRMYSSI